MERTAETPDETSDAGLGEGLTLITITIVESTSQEVYTRYDTAGALIELLCFRPGKNITNEVGAAAG